MTSLRTLRLLILAAAWLPALAGCASPAYLDLVSEDEVPELATLKQCSNAESFSTIQVGTCIGAGPIVSLVVHEAGPEDSPRAFVMIHGVWSDATCWRFVATGLRDEGQLLLIDLPGCGESQFVSPALLGPGGYSPDAMAERVLQVLDARFGSKPNPPRVTVVAHSLGGLIAMRMKGSPTLRAAHPRATAMIDRLVLLDPADVEIIQPPQVFAELMQVDGVTVSLADVTGILRDRISTGVRDSCGESSLPLREEVDKLIEMLKHQQTREASQAMLVQAVPTRHGRPNWPAIETIVSQYANIDVPCLILWGRHDETLPVSMGYKLASQIPTARLCVLDGCKHSPHLERPSMVAELIRDDSSLANTMSSHSAHPVALGAR